MSDEIFVENKKILEAALFMSSGFVSMEKLKETLELKLSSEIIKLLNELKNDYALRNSSIEILIDQNADSFGMRVESKYNEKVKHFASGSDLNKGVQKTLALVSYKQPIMQSQVIKYRNTKAYEHIQELLEKGFISRQKYGRTYILKTTKKFLEYFGELKK